MKVLQINALYEKLSTGRTMKEMHEFMQEHGIESYVASPVLDRHLKNSYKIGNNLDMKMHALLSRITGEQAYFSYFSTKGLLGYIKKINPDIVHLRNLHGNYINLKLLMKYLAENDIAVAVTLHDCWFYTGKCCHYIEDHCYRWKEDCGHCPALKKYNKSWFFDRTRKMLYDKIKWFGAINKLGVIGVSAWITADASQSKVFRKAKEIQTIFNWIDLDSFFPHNADDLKYELNIFDKFVILGIAAGWNTQKGLDIFLELSDMISDEYIIIMVGECCSLEQRNSDKIKFIGKIDDVKLLSDYYSMADVFINPSIQETFGKTTAEALASGVPVIGYNATATPEILGQDGSCGYIVDENKADLYWKKIQEINKKGKASYTDACRERAEKYFDKDTNINQYICLYKNLLENDNI